MILITGITGKSGKWLLEILSKDIKYKADGKIRAFIRDASKFDSLNVLNLPIEKFIGDLGDEKSLELAMKNVDTVLHLAGLRFSLNVVRAALKSEVRWIILVHTTGIYSKYKAAGEIYRNTETKIDRMLTASTIKCTILRPTMIYGSIADHNMIVFIKMINWLKIFPVVSGARFQLQPVHQKDLGDAYFQVLQNRDKTEGKNYILSGKQPIFLIDILRIIANELGRRPIFVSIPFFIAYSGAWLIYLISLTVVDMREKVQRLVEPRIFSHEDATRDFGYNPMGFEEGIKGEIKEYILVRYGQNLRSNI